MKYTTDHKWKPFKEDMNGPSIRYRGMDYSLDEFVSMDSIWSAGVEFENCPINVHAYCTDSYFSAVVIEVSRDGEEYRIATVIS